MAKIILPISHASLPQIINQPGKRLLSKQSFQLTHGY